MYTQEQRVSSLYRYFGWQGGTVHQLATETGLTVQQILYDPIGKPRGHLVPGTYARMQDITTRRELAKKHQGDWIFWCDAIHGFYNKST